MKEFLRRVFIYCLLIVLAQPTWQRLCPAAAGGMTKDHCQKSSVKFGVGQKHIICQIVQDPYINGNLKNKTGIPLIQHSKYS